jgi:hypothetical protein
MASARDGLSRQVPKHRYHPFRNGACFDTVGYVRLKQSFVMVCASRGKHTSYWREKQSHSPAVHLPLAVRCFLSSGRKTIDMRRDKDLYPIDERLLLDSWFSKFP